MSDDYTVTPTDHIQTLTSETSFSERQAEVWVYAYELGYSQEQIAEELAIEVGTVASHKARARTKVAEARELLMHTGRSMTYIGPNTGEDTGMVRDA